LVVETCETIKITSWLILSPLNSVFWLISLFKLKKRATGFVGAGGNALRQTGVYFDEIL
jgi:hypothetical protein